jgi:anaerobic selenocysteine-containing dehydrogenase
MGCGVLVHLENGKAIKIEGDPRSPINKGQLCLKGLASLEYLYHPDRLKYPLRRLGERGEGKWQQLSWDEALDIIASELIKVKDNYGAESVAMIHGAAKGLQDSYLARFANAFGTPNLAMQGHVCHMPRLFASLVTCGFLPIPDHEYPPNCIVVWGLNSAENFPPIYERIHQALDRGTKLIVIDPRAIGLTQKADLWLKVRPGSDLALALGMINVIINKGLYDKDFVNKWTVGFDKLKAHVQDYSPEKIEELTWVDATTIRKAARFYAISKPACIESGNSLDHNVNSFQTGRALSILMAITGNLGIPGGELGWSALSLVGRRSPELELWGEIPVAKWQRRVGAEYNLMPPFRYVLPQSVIKAILNEDPYPIHIAYIQGCNPLLTYSNAQEAHKALNKLDFLVVADMFMTPTASLADILLPVSSYLEYDSIVATPAYPVAQLQQRVAQIGKCRSDYEILNGLAKRLGLEKYFWDNEEQCLDAILKPAGITFKELKKIGVISGTKQYRKYEANGFETPSGKVELYSDQLEEWGLDPLPAYYELPETPYSDPELAKEYPLILTSWKSAPFRHSSGRQISTLRGSHPEPVASIHPEIANKLGIKPGDWVYIETKRGRIKQKATLATNIDSRVVGIDYAWWFPEQEAAELHGWAASNINILTDNKPPYNREIGSTNLRGIMCKIYKCTEKEEKL